MIIIVNVIFYFVDLKRKEKKRTKQNKTNGSHKVDLLQILRGKNIHIE